MVMIMMVMVIFICITYHQVIAYRTGGGTGKTPDIVQVYWDQKQQINFKTSKLESEKEKV